MNDFGLAEMAFLGQQAMARLVFLDQLEALSRGVTTTEATMHTALARSLWVFGPEYSLFSSNISLRRQVEDTLGKSYTGDRANIRPDLLLNENLAGEYLLIEFKCPDYALSYADYMQAIDYRHKLSKYMGDASIRVVLIGGRRSPDFPNDNREPMVEVRLFSQVIATARRQTEWLLRVEA
jgi:hypothetical protein